MRSFFHRCYCLAFFCFAFAFLVVSNQIHFSFAYGQQGTGNTIDLRDLFRGVGQICKGGLTSQSEFLGTPGLQGTTFRFSRFCHQRYNYPIFF